MEEIGVFMGGLLMSFVFWFAIPTLTFCVARVLFSIVYGFGKLISNTSSNEKAFTMDVFFMRPMPGYLYGWFGEPLSIPFFVLGSIAAVLAGVYSSHEYDFWKCMYRLR